MGVPVPCFDVERYPLRWCEILSHCQGFTPEEPTTTLRRASTLRRIQWGATNSCCAGLPWHHGTQKCVLAQRYEEKYRKALVMGGCIRESMPCGPPKSALTKPASNGLVKATAAAHWIRSRVKSQSYWVFPRVSPSKEIAFNWAIVKVSNLQRWLRTFEADTTFVLLVLTGDGHHVCFFGSTTFTHKSIANMALLGVP